MATFSTCWDEVVAGDGDVFALFYQRHADRVFVHCYSRVGSDVDAQDLTAQVFEITWRRRENVRVDPEADILPWLLATANNVIAAHLRANASFRRLLRRLPTVEHEPDHAAMVANRDEFDRDVALAVSVLRALRPADREVLELCVVQGLSPSVAARTIGTSAETARTRLRRALSRAQQLYRSAALRQDGTLGGEVDE